jgi:hypothetical protein
VAQSSAPFAGAGLGGVGTLLIAKKRNANGVQRADREHRRQLVVTSATRHHLFDTAAPRCRVDYVVI